MKDTSSFEGSMKLLQDNLKRLESGELSLEQSLKQFEEGVKLVRECQQYLAQAELKVEKLSAQGELQPLKSE